MRQLLMCPPRFFEIDYEINPWMHKSNQIDPQIALKEWEALKLTYQNLGCQVEIIEPTQGWPDMVFTANAGLTYGDHKLLLSKFKFAERQGEEPFFKYWFQQRNWTVTELDIPFEGQGESFLWNGLILAGYGFRSNEQTASAIEYLTAKKVVQLELIDPKFYHMDMALSPISADIIAYYPKAFSTDSINKIKSLGADLIEISDLDAEAFGANLVSVDKTIVMVKGTTQLPGELKSRGFDIIELDMSEFRKSGGGVRCLTLDLN